MEICSIFQTEVYCVPTQWMIIHCNSPINENWNEKLKNLFFKNENSNYVDNILFDWEINEKKEKLKKLYIVSRPNFFQKMIESYDKKIKQGTRGRLVIWFIGNLEDEFSTLLLKELPFDVGNLVKKYK